MYVAPLCSQCVNRESQKITDVNKAQRGSTRKFHFGRFTIAYGADDRETYVSSCIMKLLFMKVLFKALISVRRIAIVVLRRLHG